MSQRTEMIKRELAEHKASNQVATYAITLRGSKVYLPVCHWKGQASYDVMTLTLNTTEKR